MQVFRMFQTQTYQIEWEGQEKQPNQKDRQVYETQSNQKAIEWIPTQLHQKQREEHENKEESIQKAKSGAPTVFINNLDYPEHDILTMVDQVLTKNEFSDDSSIVMVVPPVDDDTENSLYDQTSATCIQMSTNLAKSKRKVNLVNNDPQQRRYVAAAHQGMNIRYEKGKGFCMESLPIETLSFENRHPVPKETKNKLCQISTPHGIFEKIERRCNVVSTDTVARRPCYCYPNITQYSDCSPNDKYVTSKQGMIGNPFHNRWGIQQQESLISVTVPVVPRVIPPNRVHYAQAHTQYSVNPAQHHARTCSAQIMTNLSQMQACQCSPERMLELVKLAVKDASKIQNMQSIGCGEEAPGPPLAAQKSSCVLPTRSKAMTELLDPTPERMHIEMGQTKTRIQKQVRIKETSNSTVGTSTECKSKFYQSFRIRKKTIRNIVGECPQRKPEPEPEPDLEPYLIPCIIHQESVSEDDLKKNSLETLRISGFRINKKKRPPPEAQPEYTVEDALRYYAMMYPELFQSIMAEQQANIDGTKKTALYYPADNFGLEATPSASEGEEEEGPFEGLKFKIAGKGSGSQGLAGICCFKLLQESFTTW